MKYTLDLPDELAKTLQRYADERGETPEEVLTTLVRQISPSPAPTSVSPGISAEDDDPWSGFYGRYEADVPDISVRHDEHLAEAYMETHE